MCVVWLTTRTQLRVSRPYSWCTLATCVHNCPSMMFRTCCCLRPKCKRSYLLTYITSDKFNVRYLLEILALQIAAKQLQLATWLLLTGYRNLPTPYPTVPSPTLYDVPFSHNTNVTDRQTRRTEHRTISATVLPSTKKALDYVSDCQLESACKDAPCITQSRVIEKIFTVLVYWYHHIVLTQIFKVVSFYIYPKKRKSG